MLAELPEMQFMELELASSGLITYFVQEMRQNYKIVHLTVLATITVATMKTLGWSAQVSCLSITLNT